MLFIDGYNAKLGLWFVRADEQTNREHYLIRTRNSAGDEDYFYYLIQVCIFTYIKNIMHTNVVT